MATKVLVVDDEKMIVKGIRFSLLQDGYEVDTAYDGDEAGVRAAERAVQMASKFGIYLSVVDDYHGCKDADELIQKDPELWKDAVRKCQPALEWLLEKYTAKYDLKTEKGYQEYCTEAKRLISQLDEKDTRVVMHFHPALAPFKAAVLPLSKKLSEKAGEVADMLSRDFMTDFDDAGSIGKRYRRQDEIGTPFCVTYDFDSIEDGCVTVRDRDTMQQERVKIDELNAYISEKVKF